MVQQQLSRFAVEPPRCTFLDPAIREPDPRLEMTALPVCRPAARAAAKHKTSDSHYYPTIYRTLTPMYPDASQLRLSMHMLLIIDGCICSGPQKSPSVRRSSSDGQFHGLLLDSFLSARVVTSSSNGLEHRARRPHESVDFLAAVPPPSSDLLVAPD